MFLTIKRSSLALILVLLVLGSPAVYGFSLLGPFLIANGSDAFQTSTLGYNLTVNNNDRDDLGGPKNLNEDYRWNCSDLYYAFDSSFITYFGTNGMAEVDKAFAIYNSLGNVSSYSSDLSEWPTLTTFQNYRASAAGLLDLKSVVMEFILEQLGLAQPERYTYAMHERVLPPGAKCPAYNYAVIQRNYDPVTQVYSSFVNGTLYGFSIFETCTFAVNPLPGVGAETAIYSVDADVNNIFNSVASGNIFTGGSFSYGSSVSSGGSSFGFYYTGLTRDDVAGLRYLLSSNRVHMESVDAGSLLVSTNTAGGLQLLTTQDYGLFVARAQTNSAAALQAIYPGLIILNSRSYFALQVTTNYLASLTNLPFSPVGSAPNVLLTPVYTTNIATFYQHTFGNIVINPTLAHPAGEGPFTNGYKTLLSTSFIDYQWKPVNSTNTIPTNITTVTATTTLVTNFPNGEFYIFPAGECGPYVLTSSFYTVVNATTNSTSTVIIAPGATGLVASAVSTVTYVTNHNFIYYPVQCGAAPVTLRAGIEKINFHRQDYDSLIGTSWTPVTNYHTIVSVTNSTRTADPFQRVVTQPDIVFFAQDLIGPGTAGPYVPSVIRSTPRYNSTVANTTRLAGPGTIEPPGAGGTPQSLILNKGVPAYLNLFQGTILDDGTGSSAYLWGSYDGTTNAPVIYPSSASLTNYENSLFLQITTPMVLPVGHQGQAYTAQIQATGQSPPPYSWSFVGVGLPPGLNKSAPVTVVNSPTSTTSTITISGMPTTTGIFDFVVQVSDSAGRASQMNFVIEIDL